MKVKEVRRQMSDDRRWEEERRCVKTKETMQKWFKSPNVRTFNTINTMNINSYIDEDKWKDIGYAELYVKLVQ